MKTPGKSALKKILNSIAGVTSIVMFAGTKNNFAEKNVATNVTVFQVGHVNSLVEMDCMAYI